MSRLLNLRSGLLTFALLWTWVGIAHAELASSEPSDRTVLAEAPTGARLSFTEPVEVPFSLFKVYRLEAELPGDLTALSERDWQRLSGLAGSLVSEVLTQRGDEEARSDEGVTNSERRSAEVTLALKEDLEPGTYVLMWRVLSIDSHITQGFVTFIVAPEEPSGSG